MLMSVSKVANHRPYIILSAELKRNINFAIKFDMAIENGLYQCIEHRKVVVSSCPVGDEAAYCVVFVGQSPVGEQHVP